MKFQPAVLALAFAFVVSFHAAAPALAQDAVRDLTIVAPAAPGGGWDQLARAMQQALRSGSLTRSVQVVNAAGAAGTIGLARFVNSEAGNPDALLVTGLVMVSGIAMNRSPVTLADVTPLARLIGEYEVVVVPASSPFRSLSDLVAAFRANPGAISWGGGSAGGTDEILVRLLAQRVGIEPTAVNYIAYSGGGQVLASVLGGHVSAAVSGLGEFSAHIESGELRALAISAPAPVAAAGIPTFIEQRIDVSLLNWRAVVAAPGISRTERRELEDLLRRMAASAGWKLTLQRNGWADLYMEGAAFERFLTDETARVAALVASSGPRKGGSGYPTFVLLGGLVATLAVIARGIRERRTLLRAGQRVPTSVSAPTSANAASLALMAIALVVSVVLMNVAGFLLSSTVTFALAARAFGSRRIARDVIAGAVLSAIIYVAFTRGLGVTLPQAPFG